MNPSKMVRFDFYQDPEGENKKEEKIKVQIKKKPQNEDQNGEDEEENQRTTFFDDNTEIDYDTKA